jgi:hypothetical protein
MKRPSGVTLLVLILALPAVSSVLRLSTALFFWKALEEYRASPLYIAISGGFWLLAALLLINGIWKGRIWACIGVIVGAIGYGSWYWLDRLVVQIPHANWLFALVLTILFAGFTFLILLRPKTRAYFNK